MFNSESNEQENNTSKRMFGLEEAPTFYPTEQEFLNPLEYIQKIRTTAQKYGICKVVPPKSFKPDFQLDLSVYLY